MTMQEIRALTGLNKKDFSEQYGIPYRTLQNWELGIAKAPDYLIDLIEYKVRNEMEKAKQ